MKKNFIEYNIIGQEDLKALWDNALFVFDTNILLNLYRYSEETTEQFLTTISDLKGKIWIPFKVGLEFHKNRLTVISEQKKSYVDFEKRFQDFVKDVEDKNKNPFLSSALLEKLLAIKAEIDIEATARVKYYEQQISSDALLNKINQVFDDAVGTEQDVESLKKIYAEGEKRFIGKVPPGYEDIKKPVPDRYGDLVIWKQIIDKALKHNTDIIFVTDDNKEDWWLIHEGKRISARPELLKEFSEITNQRCHFYQPSQFLKYSKKYSGSTIKDEAIEEVQNLVKDNNQVTQFLFFEISIEGQFSDLDAFIYDVKKAGYNIYLEEDENLLDSLHHVTIIVEKNTELERVLKLKYLSNLGQYHLRLIKMSAR